jgi:phosphatidylinositol alpha-mannosyltransferase
VKRPVAQAARALVAVLIVVALFAFARTIDWAESWRAIRSASIPLLLAAAALNLVSLFLKGVRWWIFLRPIGVRSLGLATRAFFVGAALNNILVANTGDAARVVFLARAAQVPSARVLATMALERFCESLGYVLLLCASVWLLDLPPALDRTRPFAAAALIAMLALVAYLIRHPAQAELPSAEMHGFLRRARWYGKRFLRTLTGISTGPRFAAAIALALVIWMLQIATYHLTAVAADFDMSIVATVAALLAVNISFIVRATPGNVGVFQAIYALTAAAFGLDKDAAIGVGLLIQTQQVLPVMILGLLAAPEMLRARRVAQPAVPVAS